MERAIATASWKVAAACAQPSAVFANAICASAKWPNPAIISGQYRETRWGYASQPVTVLGTFTLQRPVFDQNAPDTNNKTPDMVADTTTTAQGAAVTINVLANDTDANGDTLTITSVSKPQFGTATINGQSVIYTPNATFAGTDSFSYFVSDGKDGSAAGSVTVAVTGDGQPAGNALYLPLIQR